MAQQNPPNALQSAEVVKRLLITLACLTLYRIGTNIPIPGLTPEFLSWIYTGEDAPQVLSISVFALGIAPYISGAVLISLARATGWIPSLEDAFKQGESGRQKLYQLTRYATLVFAAAQGLIFALAWAKMPAKNGIAAVADTGTLFLFTSALTLTAGAMLVAWLAEEIGEKGIGSGVLLILFMNIVDGYPGGIADLSRLVNTEEITLLHALGFAAFILLTLLAVVWIETAQRKITVQYAKRVVGRMMMGGQQTSLPIKVNPAGVLAVIGAMTVISWLTTAAAILSDAQKGVKLLSLMQNPAFYFPVYALLLAFFCRHFNNTNVDPREITSNIQQNGGYLPGIRPGDPTTQHVASILDRLSAGSAVFIVAIVLIPALLTQGYSVPTFVSGTSLIIIAGVALDFMGQIQARFMMQNFGGNIPKPGGGMPKTGRRPRPKKRRKRR